MIETETPIRIQRGTNPYEENVQGKANEPITVAGLLDRAQAHLPDVGLDYSLEAIYDRLEFNAPRVAIIGGSPDHPAHILDLETTLKAAAAIWRRGGVPFFFSVPVVCDATAQSNIGMSYSLQSRNAVAEMVVNQMEAHGYHGAFVLSGCDKTPMAIVSGLAHLDLIRQRRGDAPVFATFCPAHVLRGGTLPPDLRADLDAIVQRARADGHSAIADDLRDTMGYILQCTTNSAYRGVLIRARQAGVLSESDRKDLERRLAVNTCHPKGGICAFNGTGNSSRHVVSALGLTHPAVELLTEPPDFHRVDHAVEDLFTFVNDPKFSVNSLVSTNFSNAVRIHSATGGSSNLMMHLVAMMLYAGYDVDVSTIDVIRRDPPVPDIFDYSLTQGRDIFILAKQTVAGAIRGMETAFYELCQQGVPMHTGAPTVAGRTWEGRLADGRNLGANGVKDNPIILAQPRRPFSGIEVLKGNLFESAVVKISGMTDEQIDQFDDKLCVVLFFENEDEANAGLLDVGLLDRLRQDPGINRETLLGMASHNSTDPARPRYEWGTMDRETLFDRLIEEGLLRLAVVISGQGPEAFGMPEMFTPMQHINANRRLRRMVTLISDGRYSGVTYGAAIGHVTPEAFNGGDIGLLQTGDVLHLQLRARRVDLIDPEPLLSGHVAPWDVDLKGLRRELYEQRLARMRDRQRQIAATNRLRDVTDAARGVAPRVVAAEATRVWQEPRSGI
jgi:dihydroxy-acid dehydratase